jgi:hypothetical protein
MGINAVLRWALYTIDMADLGILARRVVAGRRVSTFSALERRDSALLQRHNSNMNRFEFRRIDDSIVLKVGYSCV